MPPRVLVVEDERDLREALLDALECLGVPAVAAADGGEALSLLADREDVGLVLLDLMMPRVSGWQFLEARAHEPRLAAIPVVVITAVVGRALGAATAVPVLEKPIGLDRLEATIAQYCPGALGGS